MDERKLVIVDEVDSTIPYMLDETLEQFAGRILLIGSAHNPNVDFERIFKEEG